MTAAPVHVGAARLMLDPAGAVWWPDRRVLVVSDLHLEKGSAAAARQGRLVPPYDSRATLDRLVPLVRAYRPARVIALGDTFHDDGAPVRMAHGERDRLELLARQAEFVWVRGNHDPAPSGLPGISTDAWQEDGITFRHDGGVAVPELCGHCHPKASIETRGGWVTRPCFVSDGRRIMLPAFGAYAGGLEVRSVEIRRLFPRGMRVFLLGRQRLYSFTLDARRPAVA